MPSYNATEKARQKIARIKEVAVSFRRERVEREETNAEIREAMAGHSATAFVVSRLVWRLENGLDTSKGVL